MFCNSRCCAPSVRSAPLLPAVMAALVFTLAARRTNMPPCAEFTGRRASAWTIGCIVLLSGAFEISSVLALRDEVLASCGRRKVHAHADGEGNRDIFGTLGNVRCINSNSTGSGRKLTSRCSPTRRRARNDGGTAACRTRTAGATPRGTGKEAPRSSPSPIPKSPLSADRPLDCQAGRADGRAGATRGVL
jgi:hypothetical protein